MTTLAIESYFSEGAKLWSVRSEWVKSRDFYEMWEKVCQPKSVVLDEPRITVYGHLIALREWEGEAIAYFGWDGARSCAVISLEAPDWEAVVPLRFNPKTGTPIVGEPEYLYHESSGLSHGERLEVMYDVVDYLKKRRNMKPLAMLNLSYDDYQFVLREISKYYEEKTIRTLARLPYDEMLKLIAEALEDTPREEHEAEADIIEYQTRNAKRNAVGDGFGSSIDMDSLKSEQTFPVYPQSRFMINEQLRCIAKARREVTEYEKICRIPFAQVQMIDDLAENRGEFGIRFEVKPDLPVVEGDTLTVFDSAGDQQGTLMVDIYDGMMICGRMRFDDRSATVSNLSENLWALPVPSSAGYLAEAFDHLADTVNRDGKGLTAATEAILGLKQVDYYRASVQNPPEKLDVSQAKAWAESVDIRNSVVLVQGPPGTGKTSVLAEVLRTLVARGARLMVAAPSNAAVDNLIRRVVDLPVLRIARQKEYVAPDIAQRFWEGEIDNIRRFVDRIKQFNGGAIFAGTQVSLMKSQMISDEIEARGAFDAVVFDEAGMTRIEELILCANMGNRAILFGDHRQLLPFPLPQELMNRLKNEYGGMPRKLSAMLERSALEWLCESRGFPTMLLENCYRCQNPRLIRFSSTLFYNAAVRTHARAEYYRLPRHERERLYPPSTLSLYNTSRLPPKIRAERVVYEGLKPGIENRLEAEVCAKIVEELAERHPLAQITVIVPYRRQVRLIRHCLTKRRERSQLLGRVGRGEWEIFLSMRISTVDSFQGGESDAVVISYVRSNEEHGIGFVDEPNRINVAHTRCRRELIVIGDFKCLKAGGGGRIFNRMERAFARDGKVIDMSMDTLSKWGIFIPNSGGKQPQKPFKNQKGFSKFKNNKGFRPKGQPPAPNGQPQTQPANGETSQKPSAEGPNPPPAQTAPGTQGGQNRPRNGQTPNRPWKPKFRNPNNSGQPRPEGERPQFNRPERPFKPKQHTQSPEDKPKRPFFEEKIRAPRLWDKRPAYAPGTPVAQTVAEAPVVQAYSSFAMPTPDTRRRGRPAKNPMTLAEMLAMPEKRRGRPPKERTEADDIPREPKRRGRPPKVKTETDIPAEPKRRGRPPKNKEDMIPGIPKKRGRPAKEKTAVNEPKRRGRPPKEQTQTQGEPKRRGRPKKNPEA